MVGRAKAKGLRGSVAGFYETVTEQGVSTHVNKGETVRDEVRDIKETETMKVLIIRNRNLRNYWRILSGGMT